MTSFTEYRADNFEALPWFTDTNYNSWLIKHLQELGNSICDVGAGTGIMSSLYSKYFGEVYAVEPSLPMYEKLKLNTSSLTNVTCINASSESLPLKDKHVDISVSKSSLHHFKDIKTGLSEMLRVTSKSMCINEVIVPDSICIPFLKSLVLQKEKGRQSNTIFTEDSLVAFLTQFTSNFRSLIFDQYIIVDRWLKYSDLDTIEIQRLRDYVLNQTGEIKKKMQIHVYQGEIRMLRRMNLLIGIL